MKRNREGRTDEEKIEEFIRKHGVTICPPCRSEELKRYCFEKHQREATEARERFMNRGG